jgi:hypothetical protein
LAAQLDHVGYFELAEDPVAERAEIERQGWTGIFSGDGHIFHADGEDLAEGGVGGFIEDLGPFFHKLGITPPEVIDHYPTMDDEDYMITVDGKPRIVWEDKDLKAEADGVSSVSTLGIAQARTADLLNEILAANGREERAYGISGGNDFFIIFLTPKQFDIIQSAPGYTKSEGPYVPVNEPPDYGWRE